MKRNVKAINATIAKSYEWIDDLLAAYDFADENDAFVVLRATLKALRDRIPSGEAQQLGTQLPALFRGFYYEGWEIGRAPSKERTLDDFLSHVKAHLMGHDDIDLEMAVPSALQVIFAKIDQGEAQEVIRILPEEVRELCQ